MTRTFLPINNEICVIDNKFISQDNSIYYLKTKGKFSFKFYIEDVNNNKLFKSTYENFPKCGYLKDPENDKVLYKFKNIHHFTKANELIIECFENDRIMETIICNVMPNNSLTRHRFIINFYNKAIKKNECLEVDCSKNFKDCNVFYGKRKENGILICKFDSSHHLMGFNFKIEIAPKIDVMFIIILLNYIFRIINGRNRVGGAAAAAV
ncbi:hypothetical protein BCR32DRAFT_277261 [Anaeromyces robustus]|uniref:DUF567-domain-containing protein n=1 Tax=Anaeromyces robustus TaxID=1754192 RepID=A0A1Y1XEV1_9FUNG|nr:hypothetical protein BCR32DRAFT_277261 [Anaeromyces robustus]|eukprot:ORX84279.1 hypothetical protein BCR32DRAFT_277261 [Anaeromyces robustus]